MKAFVNSSLPQCLVPVELPNRCCSFPPLICLVGIYQLVLHLSVNMKLYDGRPARYAAVSLVGSFTGIISLFLVTWLLCEYSPVVVDSWVITAAGAFGAQTVILFTLPLSPASQPWNCVFGSVVSAFIGVASRNIFVSLTQLSLQLS